MYWYSPEYFRGCPVFLDNPVPDGGDDSQVGLCVGIGTVLYNLLLNYQLQIKLMETCIWNRESHQIGIQYSPPQQGGAERSHYR